VCDDANERCPFVAGTRQAPALVVRRPLARERSDEDRLATFRRVRDQIEARLTDWLTQR